MAEEVGIWEEHLKGEKDAAEWGKAELARLLRASFPAEIDSPWAQSLEDWPRNFEHRESRHSHPRHPISAPAGEDGKTKMADTAPSSFQGESNWGLRQNHTC